MWDLIVSVPDHCLSFYFPYFLILAVSTTVVNTIGTINVTARSALVRRFRVSFLKYICNCSLLHTKFKVIKYCSRATYTVFNHIFIVCLTNNH